MSYSHLLPNRPCGAYYPLNSRASSATLFLSQCIPDSHVDRATDPVDMTITQNLLQNDSPRAPLRRESFSHPETAQQSVPLLDNDEQLAPTGLYYGERSRYGISSNTWTSSSGQGSEDEENDDRTCFVDEYNRLAKKYGVQTIVPDEFVAVNVDKVTVSAKQGSWIMRKLLRRASSINVLTHKTERNIRHKRSVSNISLQMKPKKDTLDGKDLVDLVRLCGASPLYLPAEYAANTLAVPTCLRATAQYLVQHAVTTRGVFRIPGAHNTITALYNHYAYQDDDGEVINGTVRCPTLPQHIQCTVHDVASAFKKFLGGLPEGILGKAWLFDALMSIHCQLDSEAEVMRTKQSKVRARLIALAIATIVSKYQRELICAVLGLLSMIGRAAETAPREDEHGRPLPTSDLMGYGALGIVFGPLLVGNLLDSRELCPIGLQSSADGQRSPRKSSKGNHKKKMKAHKPITLLQSTEKIRTVISITEMLITHWRDVVRQMRNVGALRSMRRHRVTSEKTGGVEYPKLPEHFTIRRPRDWDAGTTSMYHVNRDKSPTPPSRNVRNHNTLEQIGRTSTTQDDILAIRKQRLRPMSSQLLFSANASSILNQTIEEIPLGECFQQVVPDADTGIAQNITEMHERRSMKATESIPIFSKECSEQVIKLNPELAKFDKKEISRHLGNESLLLSESNMNRSKSEPEDVQVNLKVDPLAIKEQHSQGENFKTNTLGTHRHGEKMISASPLHYKQQQPIGDISRRLVGASPFSRRSNSVQNQPEAYSQVPAGIVSSRLRSIATSDPGIVPPSGFVGARRPDYTLSTPKSFTANAAAGILHILAHFPKDPLSRISHEEDVASLASLAEAIESQNHPFSIDCSSDENIVEPYDATADVAKSHTRSAVLAISADERHSKECLLRTTNEESVMSAKETISSPMTPRRSATDSSLLHKSGSSSVKALAAKFENSETNITPAPSPVYTPESRIWHEYMVEKAVVAPYTTNTSPDPIVQHSSRSGSSLQAIRSPGQLETRTALSSVRLQSTTPSLLPKPLFSASHFREDSSASRRPKLRQVKRSTPQENDIIQVGDNRVTLAPFASNLHRTGDGNASFTLPPKLSLQTSLDQAPIACNKDFAAPVANHTDDSSSLTNWSISYPFVDDKPLNLSTGDLNAKNQHTSTLYAQIQNLSRQLKVKAHEADHLRRQLTTRRNLSDLGTLNQELVQAKTELSVWRGRAEIAEKRLQMLSQLSQKKFDGKSPDEPLALDLETCTKRVAVEGGQFNSCARNDLCGFYEMSCNHD